MPEVGDPLSEREIEVLKLAATGATNDQIARDLVISVNTVKVHLRNIFTKLGVASRTEASLYAIRQGWVVVETPETEEVAVISEPPPVVRLWPRVLAIAGALTIVIIILLGTIVGPTYLWPSANPSPAAPIFLQEWVTLSPMSKARSNLTLVPFANELYAIGGEDATGVTNVTERYDPLSDVWTLLANKPTAVSGARGAALGGEIYVPGGRDAQGQPSDVHEVYEIERNRWHTAAALPDPRTGHALVAFEGRLYLFGGWDGSAYRDEILGYTPETDGWEVVGQLPFPWGYGDAVRRIDDRILIVGGINEAGPVNTLLIYSPIFNTLELQPVPEEVPVGRAQATILPPAWLFVLTKSADGSSWELWQYNKDWKRKESPPDLFHDEAALAGIGVDLFFVGGKDELTPSAAVQAYKNAIFTLGSPPDTAP